MTVGPGRKTAPLGELVIAAFDEAARRSSDPNEVSRLATGAVMRVLRRAAATRAGAVMRAAKAAGP